MTILVIGQNAYKLKSVVSGRDYIAVNTFATLDELSEFLTTRLSLRVDRVLFLGDILNEPDSLQRLMSINRVLYERNASVGVITLSREEEEANKFRLVFNDLNSLNMQVDIVKSDDVILWFTGSIDTIRSTFADKIAKVSYAAKKNTVVLNDSDKKEEAETIQEQESVYDKLKRERKERGLFGGLFRSGRAKKRVIENRLVPKLENAVIEADNSTSMNEKGINRGTEKVANPATNNLESENRDVKDATCVSSLTEDKVPPIELSEINLNEGQEEANNNNWGSIIDSVDKFFDDTSKGINALNNISETEISENVVCTEEENGEVETKLNEQLKGAHVFEYDGNKGIELGIESAVSDEHESIEEALGGTSLIDNTLTKSSNTLKLDASEDLIETELPELENFGNSDLTIFPVEPDVDDVRVKDELATLNFDKLNKEYSKATQKVVTVEKVIKVPVKAHVKDTSRGVSGKSHFSAVLEGLKSGKRKEYIVVTGDRRSGITTTALELANFFAEKEISTLFVDFDIARRGSLLYLGLDDIIEEEEQRLHGLSLANTSCRLSNLTIAPKKINFDCLIQMYGAPIEATSLSTAQEALSVQTEYAVVIADCPMCYIDRVYDLLVRSKVLVCSNSDACGILNNLVSLDSLSDNIKMQSLIFDKGYSIVNNVKNWEEYKELKSNLQTMFQPDGNIDWNAMPLVGTNTNITEVLKSIYNM